MIPEEIIKQQDEIIGRLTRENEYLKDSQYRRSEWLREAKKEAGYPDAISFDRVWEDALKALKIIQFPSQEEDNPENNFTHGLE